MKFIGAACLLFLLACQSPSGESSNSPSDSPTLVNPVLPQVPDTTSLGGSWVLEPVLSSDTVTGKIPWLVLDLVKSRFVGNTGCNTMRGEFWFSQHDSSLSFSDKLALSRMACPGYNEAAFLKSLRSATHYRLRHGMLTLLADDNMELSRWTRKPAVPVSSGKT
jgi:heat shock protein HslJ